MLLARNQILRVPAPLGRRRERRAGTSTLRRLDHATFARPAEVAAPHFAGQAEHRVAVPDPSTGSLAAELGVVVGGSRADGSDDEHTELTSTS